MSAVAEKLAKNTSDDSGRSTVVRRSIVILTSDLLEICIFVYQISKYWAKFKYWEDPIEVGTNLDRRTTVERCVHFRRWWFR